MQAGTVRPNAKPSWKAYLTRVPTYMLHQFVEAVGGTTYWGFRFLTHHLTFINSDALSTDGEYFFHQTLEPEATVWVADTFNLTTNQLLDLNKNVNAITGYSPIFATAKQIQSTGGPVAKVSWWGRTGLTRRCRRSIATRTATSMTSSRCTTQPTPPAPRSRGSRGSRCSMGRG